MENEKKTPTLPSEVAKKYTCKGIPGEIVTRPHPKTGKRKTVNLTKITVEQADELVEVYNTKALVPVKGETKAVEAKGK